MTDIIGMLAMRFFYDGAIAAAEHRNPSVCCGSVAEIMARVYRDQLAATDGLEFGIRVWIGR